jgi:hypothetical protein
MSQISKQALIVDNNQSFPTNNAGEITPSDLRAFNVNMIDSLVNEIPYQSFTASVTNSINLLNAFTASQQPSFTALNQFTASQLTINTGYNAATYSLNASVSALQSQTSQLSTFTGSVNEIQSAGISLGYAKRFNFSGLITASITANVNGAIADISLGSDTTRVSTSSFNAYTASTNSSISNLNQFSASTLNRLTNIESTTASLNISVSNLNAFTQSQIVWNASATASINQLLTLSASLSGGYATQGELDASSSQLQNNIDTKLNTSSFNAYTASQSGLNAFTASQILLNSTFATTGSNVFTGSQTITGSAGFNVFSASIVSSTASLDLNKANFFTLSLPANANTFINIQNARAGETAMLEITTVGVAATASFSTNVYQPSQSVYIPSNTGSIDILTFASFNGTKVYLAAVKGMTNNY